MAKQCEICPHIFWKTNKNQNLPKQNECKELTCIRNKIEIKIGQKLKFLYKTNIKTDKWNKLSF